MSWYGYFFRENFDITVHVSDQEPAFGCCIVKYWLYSTENPAQEIKVVDGKAFIDVPDNFKGQILYFTRTVDQETYNRWQPGNVIAEKTDFLTVPNNGMLHEWVIILDGKYTTTSDAWRSNVVPIDILARQGTNCQQNQQSSIW